MSLFRACSSSLANFAASSSPAPRLRNVLQPAAALHSSAVRSAESQKQRVARIVRKANIEKKQERARSYEQNKPHVVLGTRPGEEGSKWANCDLAKILVTPEELRTLPPPPLEAEPTSDESRDKKVIPPKYTGYGLDGLDGTENREEQLNFFFEELPQQSSVHDFDSTFAPQARQLAESQGRLGDYYARKFAAMERAQLDQARQLARVVDLRNANARGIAFENRRRIIATFSPTGNASDSGYPEVQAALLTMKIRNVWKHLMERKQDIPSRRSLRLLVHQRAKVLKYIKRLDRDRYDRVLDRIGVHPGAVEGELVV